MRLLFCDFLLFPHLVRIQSLYRTFRHFLRLQLGNLGFKFLKLVVLFLCQFGKSRFLVLCSIEILFIRLHFDEHVIYFSALLRHNSLLIDQLNSVLV